MPANLTRCPSPDDLERLLAEDLSGPERDGVETHVEACTRCQDELARLSATNVHSVVPLAAASDVIDPEPDSAFLERLQQLSPVPSPTMTRASPDPRFPEGRVGRYEILEKLAVGGMGVVYKARHLDLGKVVALKVLPAGQVGEVQLGRFRNEMRAIGGLHHPHIVAAHDAGEADGVHYLAMAFVDGVDLARLARRPGRLPVADACEAVRQAALGLQHAFERGIVHRDVKPSNLMLARSGSVQVLDLGLARAAGGDPSERLTATGALLGTADYLAPEQWERPHAADVRADVYGLGCTLYHLLAGRPPFAGERYASPMVKMRAHHEEPPPPIAAARPDVPAGLAAVLDRMLAKAPADRFQTPAEVAAALRPFAAGADLARLLDADGLWVESPAEAALTPGPATRETTPGSRTTRPPRARRPYVLLAAVAAVGLAVVAAGFLWPRGEGPPGPGPTPVAIEDLRVHHYRGREAKDLGDIRTSEEVRMRDDVRVVARLSRPAYCYLIAFNPDGTEQLCHPAFDGTDPQQARTVRPAAVTEVRFFPDDLGYFSLDLAGLQVFVLVASAEPLPPYAEWRTAVGKIPWRAVYHGGEERWQFDGRDISPLAGARGKRTERDPVPAALRELCDFFKARGGPDAVRAVAFPVAAAEAAWRFKAAELDLARNGKYEEAQGPVRDLIALHVKEKGDGHWATAEAKRELQALATIAALPAEDRDAYTRALRQLDETVVLQKQGDYPAAVPVAKEALDVISRSLGADHMVTADVTIHYGTLLRNAGRPADAERAYRTAAAAVRKAVGDDHPTTAAVCLGLALVLDYQERPAEAKPLLDEALAIVRRVYGEDHADTAVVLNNFGGHYDRAGAFDKSESYYRRSVDLLLRAQGDDGPGVTISRHNLAYSLTNQGKCLEGEGLYRAVLRLRRQTLLAGHPDIASTCNNLAANLDAQGRHAEAESLYREALDAYRRRFGADSPIAAMTGNNLALNLQHQGKHEAARPLFEAALQVYASVGLGQSRGAAVIHNNLSSNLRAAGLPDAALEHIRKAFKIYRDVLGETHPDTAQCQYNVAVTLDALKKPAEAETEFRQAVATLEGRLGKDHPVTVQAAANLAAYLHKQGKYAAADPGLRDGLAAHRRWLGESHPNTAWTYRNLAANYWALGDYEAAAALGPPASACFEAARRRISFGGLDRVRRTDEISPLDYLAAAAARTDRPRDAWRYLEAGLARGLLDDLAVRPLTDAERVREKHLLRDLDRLDRRIGGPAGVLSGPARVRRRRERDEVQGRLVRFQADLADTYGVAAGQVYDLAKIQTALSPDMALVAWLDLPGKPTMADPAGDHWACVVRRTGDPAWVRLPAAVDEAPSLVRKRLVSRAGVSGEEWKEATARLYRQRLAPVEKHLAAGAGFPAVRHLVVLPSGDMARIPVEVLTDRFTVSYAPSGTTFAWLHADRPGSAGEPSLLAVGDPAFGPGSVARLPGTRTELQAIARLFTRPQLLMGPDASEPNLDRLAAAGDLAQFRFLHLATHGLLDDRRPLASALALAADGRLSAEQVLRTWKLQADLVTLSACESGLGEYSGGEGYLGFAQALFRAGARGTLLSLWSVDDRATTLLMTRFYENLLGTPDGKVKPAATKAEALAEAKRWLRDLTAADVDRLDRDLPGGLSAGTPRGARREADAPPTGPVAKPFAHPHYWAAFILLGDPR